MSAGDSALALPLVLGWATDLHLDSCSAKQYQAFVETVCELKPAALLLSGDIATGPTVQKALESMSNDCQLPIYFVCGNHDYYGASIVTQRLKLSALYGEHQRIHYLSVGMVVPITATTALVGHDGWADGKEGLFFRNPAALNDYVHIEELRDISFEERFRRLNQLGEQSAQALRVSLVRALEAYSRVIVVTHVPPFRENALYEGSIASDEWAPHFVSQSMGLMLLDVAAQWPQREILVLCGHAHNEAEYQPTENLRIVTGEARYGWPALQSPIVVDSQEGVVSEMVQDWVRELERLMAELRGEPGCPWDKKQTHSSLKQYLIEEAYEVLDAIDEGDDEHLANELGDVLLQVVFHSQLAREEGRFDLQEVARRCCEMLVRRHPHVFAEGSLDTAEQVAKQWEEIKKLEKAAQKRVSALDGIPRHLPALAYAEKIQAKAAKVGFDFPSADGPLAKIQEELLEVQEAMALGDRSALREELGDLLFAVVNLVRFCGADAEGILRANCQKFRGRFVCMEDLAQAEGRELSGRSLGDLERLWHASKAVERSQPGNSA